MARISPDEAMDVVSRCLANHRPKKLVYLAGPLTNPCPMVNTHRAIHKAEALHRAHPDWAIFIPHLTSLWEMVAPKNEPEYWYAYDLHILQRCDLLYRMTGFSPGADGEVAMAAKLGIPVIFEADE